MAAPLAVRTAQLQEVLGTTCSCARCSLEAFLPAEVTSLISDAYAKVEGAWARAYQEGLMAGDGDALAALQVCADTQLLSYFLFCWAFGRWGVGLLPVTSICQLQPEGITT